MPNDTPNPTPNPTATPAHYIEADMVLLDDNQVFADAFKFRFLRKKVEHYLDPRDFIQQHARYVKDTVICIDNDFGLVAPVNGIEVAAQLHQLGFTRLFLISGTYFSEDQLPDYLTFIEKINLEFFSVF